MLTAEKILAAGQPPDLQGLSASVLGLARSGSAAAKMLKAHGCHVLVSDSGHSEALETAAADLRESGVGVEIGGHTEAALACDLLVRSPGIPNSNPILIAARKSKLLVISEIELASWFCLAPIIAVTGSNGKTTTTEWLGDLFRRAGRPVAVCGNVGHPFSTAILELSVEGVAVVEVSSFQLEDVLLFSPRVAIITNFSPDHLDRYASYKEYLQAKCRIFNRLSPENALVYNREDAEVMRRIGGARGRYISFGRGSPRRRGAGVIEGTIVYVQEQETLEIASVDKLSLPGPHNLENALAVTCAAAELGASAEQIAASLTKFPGVPHRLEKVAENNGILWINDSKATNIASGLVALNSFSRPIVLLAGGRDKGSNFSAVAEEVKNKTRLVILFGEAGPLMEKAWSGMLSVERLASLKEAVRRAAEIARKGDVILLSPMCASFDEFRNYEDRGDRFKEWVRHDVQSNPKKPGAGI